ncbi:hypothetical protein KEM55_000804, partial [Ascosphaera atra]
MALDHCKTRPAHIHAILTGLDRYNPETTSVFQDYVAQQYDERRDGKMSPFAFCS